MKTVIVRAAVAAFLVLGLAAPAAAVEPIHGPSGASGAVKVKIKDSGTRRFSPSSITIERGTKVKWVNKGTLTHTTTANNGAWDETLSPGETFSRRFRRAGTFSYHCSIHPSMTGTITVT
jgi:plastocyanin